MIAMPRYQPQRHLLTKILWVGTYGDEYDRVRQEMSSYRSLHGEQFTYIEKAMSHDAAIGRLLREEWNVLALTCEDGVAEAFAHNIDATSALLEQEGRLLPPMLLVCEEGPLMVPQALLGRLNAGKVRLVQRPDTSWQQIRSAIYDFNTCMLNILSVEDDDDDFEYLRDCVLDGMPLKSEIDRAGSVDEATALLAGHRYDVVFVDYYLPDLNGTHLLRSLTGTERQPLVVICTGADELALDSYTLRCISELDNIRIVAKQTLSAARMRNLLLGLDRVGDCERCVLNSRLNDPDLVPAPAAAGLAAGP